MQLKDFNLSESRITGIFSDSPTLIAITLMDTAGMCLCNIHDKQNIAKLIGYLLAWLEDED